MNACDVPLCEEMRQEFVRVQQRADSVARLFGDAAPQWLAGESDLQYRRRLARQFQKYSPAWRGAELGAISGKALETVESQIYTDAAQEAQRPTSLTLRPGELVERIVTDDSGRRTRRFYGDPEACWGPFKTPSRLVTAWNVK
jgi:hypothetical protein